MKKVMESEYRPYSSDSESSDAESTSDGGDNFTDYSSDTNTASIADIVSPQFLSNFRIRTQQISKTLASSKPLSSDPNSFSMEGTDAKKPINYGTTKFATASRPQTTQIILQSQDRDRTAFPNPTDFTIRFPRTYKNVTNIDLANMNFLNTLLFFRDSRNNTSFNFYETGRPIPNLTQFPATTVPATASNQYLLKAKIREGSYNISSLQQELLYSLNTGPIFFYYKNGYSDFAPLFAASGSFALNFNAPGDYFYDSLNDQFITLKSIDDVVLRYFSSTTGNQTRYTNTDILVAYYYPVIKEAFLESAEYDILNKSVTASLLLPGEDLESRVIYNFQGLQDKVIIELINLNRAELDLFRNRNTYLTRPINNYSIRENTFNKHLVFSASSLATSIKNSIKLKADSAFITSLDNEDITQAQYNSQLDSNRNLLATLSEMRDFVFTTMAEEFGVPFNSYDIDALFCNTSLFNLQNGKTVCNVPLNYSLTSNTSLFPDYNATSSPPKILFESMSNLDPKLGSSYDPDEINGARKAPNAFDVDGSLFNDSLRNIFIQSGGNSCNVTAFLKNDVLNINHKKRTIDVIATIEPSKYAVYKFKSPCRQTIQVETLPIPQKFRYTNYNSNVLGGAVANTFNRDLTYSLPVIKDTLNNIINYSNYVSFNFNTARIKTIDVSYNMNGFSAAPIHTLKSIDNRFYFKLMGPIDPSNNLTSDTITSINVSIKAADEGPLKSQIVLTHYGDYSAFIADAKQIGSESPELYLNTTENSVGASQITLSNLQIRGGDEHYFIVRSKTANFENTPFKIYSWYSDSNIRVISADVIGHSSAIPLYLQNPESNANMYKLNSQQYTNIDFFKNYDKAYLKLPIDSNLYVGSDPENNAFNDPLIPGAPFEVPMGYDNNGVSTDLTDYKGVPLSNGVNTQTAIYESTTRFDPESEFLFKLGSSQNYYDTNADSYLSGNVRQNAIISSFTNTPYVPGSVAKKQHKIVHWNDPHYIAPSPAEMQPLLYNYSSNMTPINVNQIVEKYNNYPVTSNILKLQDATTDSQGNITFGDGVAGFTFLPSDGEWEIDGFMFKSAYFDSATDPNKQIKFIGIFDTSATAGYNIEKINLSNACCILSNTNRPRYFNNPVTAIDKQLGAYHIFKTVEPNTLNLKYIKRPLAGYSRSPKEILIQDRSHYSIVPFDSNGHILTYYMPAGSLIANEQLFSNSVIADTVYMKQTNNYVMPNQSHILLPDYTTVQSVAANAPSYIKPVNYTQTSNLLFQSKYEQSVPIIAPKIQYINDIEFDNDENGLFNYDPYDLIPNPDARLFSTSGPADADGFPVLSFVTNPANLIIYQHKLVNYKDPLTGEVKREMRHTGLLDLKPKLMADSYLLNGQPEFYFNPATEEVVTWCENAIAKYVLVRKLDSSDIKILKLTSSDNFDTFVTTIMLNYNGSDSINGNVGVNYNRSAINFQGNKIYMFATDDEMIVFAYENITLPMSDARLNYYLWDSYIRQQNVGPVLFDYWELYSFYNVQFNKNSKILSVEMNPSPVEKTIFIYNLDYAIVNGYIEIGNRYRTFGKYTKFNFVSKNECYCINSSLTKNIYKLSISSGINTSTFLPGTSIIPVKILDFNNIPYTTQAISASLPYETDKYNFDWNIIPGVNQFIFKWQLGNFYSFDGWKVLANICNDLDTNRQLKSYSQIFYPTMKLTMRKTKASYNSITDTELLIKNIADQTTPLPNWGRSEIFFYNDISGFKQDLGLLTNETYDALNQSGNYQILGIYKYHNNTDPFKWGCESNFVRADTSFNGYYFNSYVYNMTLSNTIQSPSGEYYLAIRGSLPSESYQTLVRINAPNRLDFGFITMANLINEIVDLSGNEDRYNPEYLERLVSFNNRFKMTNNYFGDAIYSNYLGVPVTTTSNANYFSNFYSQMSNVFSQYKTAITQIDTISSNVATATNNYLETYWTDIVPPYVLERERVTDPVTFSPLFYSSLSEAYKDLDEEWGLGWNLGFPKQDLPAATVHFASNIYKIFYETIYLRLADYQGNMNMIDKTGRERLSNTNTGQGETKQYFAKLLLNSFGSFSSTAFQNPPSFNPPIGKLDKLRFQWIDPTGEVIDNKECDWNAVMRITEQIEGPTAESTFITYK